MIAVLRVWGVARLAMAGLVAAALIAQVVIGRSRPTFSIANFFSFFTVDSNVIAAVVMGAAGVLAVSGRAATRLSAWRGAATLYMTITGVVYVLLLSGLEESLQTATPWVNTVLHYVMPVAMLIDFLADRSVARLTFATAAWWLLFPLGYLAYSLIRGPLVHWYPYPFLNPGPHGYGVVAVVSVGIAVFAAGLAWLLAASTRIPRR